MTPELQGLFFLSKTFGLRRYLGKKKDELVDVID